VARKDEAVQVEKSKAEGGKSRPWMLVRGESVIASAGITLSALLLTAMAASAGWFHASQRQAMRSARAAQVQTTGTLLAHSAEVLLSRNEVSAVRTLVAEAGRSGQFSECRIVLPDGSILASMEPSTISVRLLPDKWPEGSASDSSATAGTEAQASIAMNINGHGPAALEIVAPFARAGWSVWQTQAGIGGIGAGALFVLLLIYRRMRWRLRALGAIREALLTSSGNTSNPEVLSISTDLGPEATAWNTIIADMQKLRRQSVTEKVKEVVGRRQEGHNDLEAACDALSQGLMLVDEANRIRYANGAAAAFLRSKHDDLIGADITKFIQVDSVLASIREVATGASRRRSVQDIERQDGGVTGVLRFSVRPVRRQDSASAMLTIDDITQQRVAEEARHSFVAQATHELRTPLTNIRLYVETAIEDGESDPATRARCLNVINGETRRLERIVGEMLSVAEIEAGSFKLNSDDVRLDALFTEIQGDFQQQAIDKHIELIFNLPPKIPVVKGDRDKIVLALHNLVGNALKYTPEHGKVEVKVEFPKGRVVVEVKDTGIGISPDDQQKVFERFYRAQDPRVAKITGTGLGLTLAREVARLHGGDITLESEIDHGATFTLTLPASAEAA
jgi:PAS domain S-box-containing protein